MPQSLFDWKYYTEEVRFEALSFPSKKRYNYDISNKKFKDVGLLEMFALPIFCVQAELGVNWVNGFHTYPCLTLKE